MENLDLHLLFDHSVAVHLKPVLTLLSKLDYADCHVCL